MKVTAELKCPGCQFSTKVAFKQPTSLRTTIISFVCETCGSTVSVQVRRGDGKTGIKYRVQVQNPSALLNEMRAEEAAFNASEA